MSTLERPPSLSSVVTDHIRSMIIRGELPLGASVSERGISADLKVSKTPVREALAQLRNEGLVSIVPQSGVRVFTLSAREVREICAFRKVLESAALELSMAMDPVSLLKDLELIEAQMHEAMGSQDVSRYLALDTDFHLAFFFNCGNGYLQSAYGLYAGKIAALRTHLAVKPQHTQLSMSEHCQIVEAVRRRDTRKLLTILEDHIGRTQESYEIGIEDISVA